MQNETPEPIKNHKLGRREFLASTAAAYVLTNASLVRGSTANSKIELGLIGCGVRGKWIAKLFEQHGNYKFVSGADYFQDRVDEFGDQFEVDKSKRYTTLSGYKKLLNDELDAVVIESPPYCHPEQAEAAVKAGKHVFLAKPIAIDVPGCKTVEESAKAARDRKQVFLIDFQTRTDPHYIDYINRVHKGEIGKLMGGDSWYLWAYEVKCPTEKPEDRLRHWYAFLDLSGDFIVEQNIHTIDVAAWIMNHHPTAATGRGGRYTREHGNIWDSFQVLYDFPEASINFTGMQCAPGAPDWVRCRVFGTKGLIDTDYFGEVFLKKGKDQEDKEGVKMDELYTKGAVANIKEFQRCIEEKDYAQKTVKPSVESNLAAILGREAAYARTTMTWDELLKANKKIPLKTEGLKM